MGLFSRKADVAALSAERDLAGLARALRDDQTREQAVAALIELDDPAALAPVARERPALKASPELEDAKLRITRHFGARAVEPLSGMVLAGDNEVAAAEMLAALGTELAEPPLLEAAGADDKATRKAAMRALGRLPAAELTPTAIAALGGALSDPDLPIAAAAASSIEALGDRRAVPYLCKALQYPEHEARHHLGKDALAKLGGLQVLDELLDDPDPGVRLAAVEAFGGRREDSAVDRLRELAANDPGPEVRVAAAIALFDCGGERTEVADLLASQLTSGHAEVEGDAALALAELGDPRALPAIGRMLESDDLERAVLGAHCARRLDHPEGLAALERRAARDPEFDSWQQAHRARTEAR